MPKLPQISGRALVGVLEKDGWVVVGQRGSHVKLRKTVPGVLTYTVIVPMHRTLKKGTLAAILRDSGISLDRLRELL